jgi:hypothetical protein
MKTGYDSRPQRFILLDPLLGNYHMPPVRDSMAAQTSNIHHPTHATLPPFGWTDRSCCNHNKKSRKEQKGKPQKKHS